MSLAAAPALTLDTLISHMTNERLGALGLFIYHNLNNGSCDHVNRHWGSFGLHSEIPAEFVTAFTDSVDGMRLQVGVWEIVQPLVDAATELFAADYISGRLLLAKLPKKIENNGEFSFAACLFSLSCSAIEALLFCDGSLPRVFHLFLALPSARAEEFWKAARKYAKQPTSENLTALVLDVLDEAILRVFG